MNLDSELLSIINKIANRNSITSKDLIDAIEHLQSSAHKEINNGKDVFIHNFGRFQIDKRSVTRSIKFLELLMENDPNDQNLVKEREKLIELQKNLLNNKRKRNDNRSK